MNIKEIFQEIKLFLIVLTRPSFWFSNYSVDKNLDDALRLKIKQNRPVKDYGEYLCAIDGLVLWIGNYPYAYGHLYYYGGKFLPTRRTRILLKKYIMQKYIESKRG